MPLTIPTRLPSSLVRERWVRAVATVQEDVDGFMVFAAAVVVVADDGMWGTLWLKLGCE